jgi:hypothetical protein
MLIDLLAAGAAQGSALPGTAPFPAELQTRLDQAVSAQGKGYKARTRHLLPDGSPKYTNRLILESSPYLNQHAHNPVSWYAWGDEAFETAKRLGRPVLLSVGYSTCHWCHVMEEESFEDEEIAQYLNENYVAIKVDREERPDIDAIYMSAVQAMTGRGGWPMTVWLTPDRKPFYGGTYFPARDGDRGARNGFLTVLRVLRERYRKDPSQMAAAGQQMADRIREELGTSAESSGAPKPEVLDSAASAYSSQFDHTWGGLSRAPKFPSNLPIRFLLRQYVRTGSSAQMDMAALTLQKMAEGGIHDQIGGGFHRYSTDAKWLVPHFEKMLYDNALLAVAYLEAFQSTGRNDFADNAREILGYVQREMTSPDGGFYSATDADSATPSGKRVEGYFFTWTPAELAAVVGKGRAALVNDYFGVTASGNFEGRNILHVAKSVAELSKETGKSAAAVRQIIDGSRAALLAARSRRPPPGRDDKVVTSWNGLMISALARASFVLNDPKLAQSAERAAKFLLERHRKDGRLLRRSVGGSPGGNAFLDDYAFLIAGLLDLYEVTGNPRWISEALTLQTSLDAHYLDAEHGGYFATSDDHEALLAREKPSYDGAEPSGNSVEAMNLLRLYEFTIDDRYRTQADRVLAAFAARLARSPTAMSEMLLAVDFRYGEPKEIVIVVPKSRSEAEPFLSHLRRSFVPNKILVVAVAGKDLEEQARVVPILREKVAAKGVPTAYVCERGVCQLPTSDPSVFAKQIASRGRATPR